MELALGWFDADEEHIPFDVLSSCSWTSAGECLIQQVEISDLIDLRQEPIGKTATAGTGNLPAQQLDRAFENPVVVRFYDAILAMIEEPNHARVFDGCPEQRMGLELHSIILTRVRKIAGYIPHRNRSAQNPAN